MTNSLLMALGFFLIIEGVFPALFPNRWRGYLAKVLEMPINSLRTMGIISCLSGFLIIYLFS